MLQFRARFIGFAVAISGLLLSTPAAQAELLYIPTGRGDTVPVYWEKTEGATATVILLAGGSGQVKFAGKEGKPRGNNFLVRSYALFADQKVNVAVMGSPSNIELSDEFRVSDAHTSDLAAIATTVRGLSATPVWLVGTSRGTISAAATAIRFDGKNLIDGLVLTSAVVGYKKRESVARQDIDKIHIPVLVYMHENDACVHCLLTDAKVIGRKFKNASVYALKAVSGGSEPTGDPCEAKHYHGFIGMESQAVSDIVGWINNPVAVNK